MGWLRSAFGGARLRRAVLVLGIIIGVALLWQQAFTMTGVSRWHERASVERPAPPEPISIEPLPADWVDLKAYQQTHPVWQP